MDAVFFVKKIQEEYQKKEKSCACDLLTWEKTLDIVPRKAMEWVKGKKCLLEVTV